jgi:hypothetical protein
VKILTKKGEALLRYQIKKELAEGVAKGMAEAWQKKLDEAKIVERAAGVDEGLAAGRKLTSGAALGELAAVILSGRRNSARDMLIHDYALSRVLVLEDKEEGFDTFLKGMQEAIGMSDKALQAGIDEAQASESAKDAQLSEGLMSVSEAIEAEG